MEGSLDWQRSHGESNCKTNLPPSSPSAYFFSITISQPKIRVKIPKIVVKSMQRRLSGEDKPCKDANNDQKVKERKRESITARKLLPKKVGRIFSDVFGHKKTAGESTCSLNGESRRDRGKNAFDLADEKDARRLKKAEMEEMGLVQRRIKDGGKYVNGAEKQCRDVNGVTLESEEDNRGGGKKKRLQQLSFKVLFNKRNTGSSRCNNGANGVGTSTAVVEGRQESSHGLPRVPSRILTTRQRLKMARSMRNKPAGSGEYEQEDGERSAEELCKKRILMGDRCRPLNHCGALQYNKDGVLLPDIIP